MPEYITKGRITNYGKGSLVLNLDINALQTARADAAAAAEDEDSEVEDGVAEEKDNEEGTLLNPLSMESVALQCPDFANVQSMLEVVVKEERGHELMLSPKYHAELAGQGIEYDFGRCKWRFRNNNSHSTAGLRLKALQSFSIDKATIGLTRKYTRRARDYKRVYRWGSMMGL